MSKWLNITNGETAEIDITGTIGGGFFEDGTTTEQVREDVQAFSDLEASKIIVNIESLGGSVQHALAIHDIIAANKAHVEVRITGLTASSATIIAMAGDKVTMSDNALFLVHRASMFAMGDAEDIDAAANELRKVEDRLVNIYVKKTGRSEKNIRNLMSEDKGNGIWLTADEAKKKGFIDEVFEPTKMVAQITENQFNNFNLPIPITMEKQTPEEKSAFKKLTEDLKGEFKSFMEGFKNAGKTPETKKPEPEIIENKTEELTASLKEKETELATATEKIGELEKKVLEDAKNSTEVIEKFGKRIDELEKISLGEDIADSTEEGDNEMTDEEYVLNYKRNQIIEDNKLQKAS